MRLRMTVADHATGLRSDVLVECGPDDRTGAVLAAVAQALPVIGDPTVDGVPLDPAAAVVRSALGDGVLLRYGVAGTEPAAVADGPLLRVISGASAGTELRLGLGMVVEVGRSSTCGLVLDDPAVSRRHATLLCLADGVELTDRESLAGVLVAGTAIRGRHRLRIGEVVQLGGSRLVLEAPGHARLPLERRADGRFAVPWAAEVPVLPRPGPVLRWPAPLRPLPPLLRRAFRGREAEHRLAVQRVEAQAERAADDEDAELRVSAPDPATVQRIAMEPRVGLWARRPPLCVRLGTADREATAQIGGQAPAGWERPRLRRAPLRLDLDAVGTLGIAGPAPWVADRMAWVVLQCAVLHGPDALPIIVFAPEADEHDAGWLRWLPHLRAAAWDPDDVAAVVRAAVSGGPALVLLLGGTGSVAAQLLHVSGLRLVCTGPDARRLPVPCRAVLACEDDDGSGDGSGDGGGGGGAGELRVDGGAPVRLAPDVLAPEAADRIARRLAPLVRPSAPQRPQANALRAVPIGWSMDG